MNSSERDLGSLKENNRRNGKKKLQSITKNKILLNNDI